MACSYPKNPNQMPRHVSPLMSETGGVRAGGGDEAITCGSHVSSGVGQCGDAVLHVLAAIGLRAVGRWYLPVRLSEDPKHSALTQYQCST